MTTPVNPEIDQSVTPHPDRNAPARGSKYAVAASSRRRARWIVRGAVAATAVVALTAAVASLVESVFQPALESMTADAPSTPPVGGPTPAQAVDLHQFAGRLVAAPFEARKAAYEYTDVRGWEALPATGPGDTVTVSVRRIKHWTNTVDSGRWYVVDETKSCPATTDDAWSARQAGPWDGPLSSDPDAVRRQLLGPPPNDGIDLFGQIGELFAARIVPVETRRGILRMLAQQPNISVHDGVRDQIGRSGVAVVTTLSPPNQPLRKTLIFDSVTGDLLASATTETALASPPIPDVAPWQREAFVSYNLILDRAYTPNVSTPAPECTTS